MGGSRGRRIQVQSLDQVVAAQELARLGAREMGFPFQEGEEIALAVHELAANLVRHTWGGVIEVRPVAEADRTGLEILSEDAGPGISAPEQALVDGFSTAGGLGVGLGAVHRLMDDFELAPRAEGGTRIHCRRWVRSSQDWGRCPLEFGVASRPRRGERCNGDAFLIKTWSDHALCGIIDGVGHGQPAQLAAQTARQYIEMHPEMDLERLFEGTDRVARGTRGVVMALAQFDLARGALRYASVGNIEGRLDGSQNPFLPRRGIIGFNAPRTVVTQHEWGPASSLILHSDGVRGHWAWGELPMEAWAVPGVAARHLLNAFGRDLDDATVLIVKARRHGH